MFLPPSGHSEKSYGLDGITSEILKIGAEVVVVDPFIFVFC